MRENEDEDIVKLEPFMGIRPGVYLVALYSAILLLIVFFLLIHPGLKKNGAMLVVKTEPAGAAIRVDGTYMGVSGGRIFLPKGTHLIEAVLPGFESQSAEHRIPGRVFASLFFPRIYKTEFTLKTSDPTAAFAMSAADFAEWTFAGEPTAGWQIPMSLSEGAYRVGPAANTAMYEILNASLRFAVTRAALRDLIRAKILLDNRGLSPSPAGLLGSISDAIALLSEIPGSGRWLTGLLPPESADLIKSSAWHEIYYAENTDRNTSWNDRTAALPARMQLTGLTFINVNNIMVSETPATRSLFENFLDQNPEWREHKTDYYPEQLAAYPSEVYGRDVITGVTWFAAEAFCRWLTLRLPPGMSGMEVRLPTEAEWEEYSFVKGIDIGDFEGRGWEWCADPFAPRHFIFPASPEAIEAVGSPERSIRRLSFMETRASLPPEISSPYVSFRPIIAQKGR